MAERRRDQADEAVRLRIAATYTWVLVPEQPDPKGTTPRIDTVNTSGSQERLAERVSAKLRQNGQLATKYGARNVRMDLDGPLQSAWSRGHISVGELWSYYRRYPYLTRLADRSVLADAVTAVFNLNTWELEGFALAEGFDETTGRYIGLSLPHESDFGQVTDNTLLVLPALARQQQHNDQVASGQDEQDTGTEPPPTSQAGTDTPPPPAATGQQQATNARFFGVIRLNPERYARDSPASPRRSSNTWPPTVSTSTSPSRSAPPSRTASPTTRSASSPRTPAPSSSTSSASRTTEPQTRSPRPMPRGPLRSDRALGHRKPGGISATDHLGSKQ